MNNLYIPRIGLPIWLQQYRQTVPRIYINRALIHECGNWKTEHYNSVLEVTRLRSFISGKHKSELDIYIGISPALHLQCALKMFCVHTASHACYKSSSNSAVGKILLCI